MSLIKLQYNLLKNNLTHRRISTVQVQTPPPSPVDQICCLYMKYLPMPLVSIKLRYQNFSTFYSTLSTCIACLNSGDDLKSIMSWMF